MYKITAFILAMALFTLSPEAKATNQSPLIEKLIREFPQGRHVGLASGKEACYVDVDLISTGAGETSYRAIIYKSSSTKAPPQFELRTLDKLKQTPGVVGASYVGDPNGIAGIRTWVSVVRTKTDPNKSDFQILVASDGNWIIRIGGAGLPTCKISALR